MSAILSILEAAVPASIEARGRDIRVRFWASGGFLGQRMRRTDLTLPLNEIAGVAHFDHGGNEANRLYTVVIRHSSGLNFSTPWNGPHRKMIPLGEKLAAWLEACRAAAARPN